jgi:hypothetical protein
MTGNACRKNITIELSVYVVSSNSMEMIGASQGVHKGMFARAKYIRNVPYLMLCEVAAAVRAAGRPGGPARIGLTRPAYRRPSCVLVYVLNIGWHAVAVW